MLVLGAAPTPPGEKAVVGLTPPLSAKDPLLKPKSPWPAPPDPTDDGAALDTAPLPAPGVAAPVVLAIDAGA